MKSKKVVWFTVLVVLVAAVGISCVQRVAKAQGEFVQELRLYFDKRGVLVKVEPINMKNYTVERIPNLYGEKIGGGVSVMFGRTNPTCTYWYTYEMGSGYQRICLRWE